MLRKQTSIQGKPLAAVAVAWELGLGVARVGEDANPAAAFFRFCFEVRFGEHESEVCPLASSEFLAWCLQVDASPPDMSRFIADLVLSASL